MRNNTKRERFLLEQARKQVNLSITSGQISDQNPWLVFHRTRPRQSPAQYDLHAYCELGIVLRGSMEILYPRQNQVLGSGGIWWHGPWEPHGWVHRTTNTAIIVMFMPAALQSLAADPEFHSLLYFPFLCQEARRRMQPGGQNEKQEIFTLARKAQREQEEKKPGWRQAQELLLCQLLLTVARLGEDAGRALAGQYAGTDRIIRAINYIQANLSSKIYLKDAAAKAGLGRTRFETMFRRLLGLKFSHYLLYSRLERARHQLQREPLKLAYLAKRWGFHDASHFSKMYARHFGHSPGQEKRIVS